MTKNFNKKVQPEADQTDGRTDERIDERKTHRQTYNAPSWDIRRNICLSLKQNRKSPKKPSCKKK